MTQENDDSDLVPLVAVGATLVATGTALSSVQPLLGLVIIVGAVTLLVFALVRMVQRQRERMRGASLGDQSSGWWFSCWA